MNYHILERILCLVLVLLPFSIVHANDAPDKNIRYVPAKRLSISQAVYPRNQYRKSNAGMVKVGYMVNKEGKPEHLFILESSHDDFAESALKAVSKYNFEPALYYGVPRESYHTMRLLFQGRQQAAVLPEFAVEFNAIKELLENDDVDSDSIYSRITGLKDGDMLNPYATTQINKLLYFYQKKYGSKAEQIKALKALLLYQGMSGRNGQFLDVQTATIAYQDLFNLLLEKGDYNGASQAYHGLRETDPKYEEIYKEAIDQMTELAKDDRAFEASLEIGGNGYTAIDLWKRKFSFFDVDEEITELKLRCELKYQELEFHPETLYQIPEEWGDCNLQIIGEPEVAFTLIQQ